MGMLCVLLGRNKTRQPRLEHAPVLSRFEGMGEGAQKLRSLARQARALAGTVSGRESADALQALARLYEKQAGDLDVRELWVESGHFDVGGGSAPEARLGGLS